MKKTDYGRIAVIALAVMTAIFILFSWIALKCNSAPAATWHYLTLFANFNIVWWIFLKQRALWEIGYSYKTNTCYPPGKKPLTSYLLEISWAVAIFFFLSYLLSFFPFFQAWLEHLPDEFRHLFRTPALWSGIIWTIMTGASQYLRHKEAEDW